MKQIKQLEKKIENYYLGVYTLISIVIFTVSIGWLSTSQEKKLNSLRKNIVETTCLITHLKDEIRGSGDSRSWLITTKYEFTVNGKKYIGSNLGDFEYPFFVSGGIYPTLRKYNLKKGNTLKVYYNKNAPTQSFLFFNKKETSNAGQNMFIVAIISFIILLIPLFKIKGLKTRLNHRKLRQTKS